MPTQEERLTNLEKSYRETSTRTKEIEENTTIMLGVVQAQGWDIKKIFRRIETIDDRLEKMDGRLDRIENTLEQILARLSEKPQQ